MLKGIVAFVTGGASGLGRATVERVIKQGGKAVICDLPSSKGANLAKKLGSNTIFCPADVTSETDIENSLKVTKEQFGHLDVVVNNAGKFITHKMYHFSKNERHSFDVFNEMLMTNVFGVFNVIRCAVSLIGENEPNEDGYRGVIINTASTVALDNPEGCVAYTASKGAVAAITLSLAREFSPLGIRVCAIAPGLFSTPMGSKIPENVRASMKVSTPHPKRAGKPDEFAMLVQSIIQNPFINGEIIRLDGGLRMN